MNLTTARGAWLAFVLLMGIGCTGGRGADRGGGAGEGGGSGDDPAQGGSTGEGGGGGGDLSMPDGGSNSPGGETGGHDASEGGAGGAAPGGVTGSAGAGGSGGVATTGGTSAGGAPATGGVMMVYAAPKLAADFENGTLGQAPPAPFQAGDNKGVVDATRAYSGTKSIRVQSSSNSGLFNLPVGPYIAANRKTGYARFMLWLEQLPTDNATRTGHWDFVKFNGTIKGDGRTLDGFVSFGGFGTGRHKLHMWGTENSTPRVDCAKSAVMVVRPQRWTCIEMKIDETEILNYGVSIDGKPIQPFGFPFEGASSDCVAIWNLFRGTWHLPEISSIGFGFNHVHAQASQATLWIDDVAVSPKPIGCPPAKQP